MTSMIQILMAFLGSLGFAIMFNVRGIKLLYCALGGSVTWTIFLIVKVQANSIIGGIFLATLTISLISEILARKLRAPVIMFLVPMLIPLIPGSDLYYTTNYLINNEMTAFMGSLVSLSQKVGAIASGIILMTSMVQIFIYGKRTGLTKIAALKNIHKK